MGGQIGCLVDVAIAVDFKFGDFIVAQGKGAQGEPAGRARGKVHIDDGVEIFAGRFEHRQQGIAIAHPPQVAQNGAPLARRYIAGNSRFTHAAGEAAAAAAWVRCKDDGVVAGADFIPREEVGQEAVFAKGLHLRLGRVHSLDQLVILPAAQAGEEADAVDGHPSTKIEYHGISPSIAHPRRSPVLWTKVRKVAVVGSPSSISLIEG